MRRLHCGRHQAVVLLFLLLNDRRLFPSVHGRFRGAQPKAIPYVSKDGRVEEQNPGAQQQVVLEKIAPGKGVRRMKGGMLPWWVRKRMHEKGSTTDASVASKSLRLYQSGSRSRAKTLNKDVEVVLLAATDREEDAAGDTTPETVGAESAIVIEDLPLEDGEGAEDSRAAAYQDEVANMADKAKAEELARGSQADPDLLAAGANVGTEAAEEGVRGALPDIMGGAVPEGSLEEDLDHEAMQHGQPRGAAGGQDPAQAGAAALVSRGQPDEVLAFEEEEQASGVGGGKAAGAREAGEPASTALQRGAGRGKPAGEGKTRLGTRSAHKGGNGRPAAGEARKKGSVVSALKAARREEAASGGAVARALLSWPGPARTALAAQGG